jgi:hypothetical protein
MTSRPSLLDILIVLSRFISPSTWNMLTELIAVSGVAVRMCCKPLGDLEEYDASDVVDRRLYELEDLRSLLGGSFVVVVVVGGGERFIPKARL